MEAYYISPVLQVPDVVRNGRKQTSEQIAYDHAGRRFPAYLTELSLQLGKYDRDYYVRRHGEYCTTRKARWTFPIKEGATKNIVSRVRGIRGAAALPQMSNTLRSSCLARLIAPTLETDSLLPSSVGRTCLLWSIVPSSCSIRGRCDVLRCDGEDAMEKVR